MCRKLSLRSETEDVLEDRHRYNRYEDPGELYAEVQPYLISRVEKDRAYCPGNVVEGSRVAVLEDAWQQLNWEKGDRDVCWWKMH